MTPWNKFNQCMAIAARCSSVFCKLFKIEVTTHHSLWIDLYPIDRSSNNIHMVSDSDSNKLEIYFNLSSKIHPFSEDELNSIAYKLGINLLNQYAIIDDGIIFFLDELKNVSFYEDSFSFMGADHKLKTIETDYPLLHYMQTEIEVGTIIYLDSHQIIRPNAAVVKNGIPMFDVDKFIQQQSFLIIYISKTNGVIDVDFENCNFVENPINIFGSISLVSSLPYYGVEDNDNNGTARIYFSSYDDNNGIHKLQINRFENVILSKEDIENALLKIQEKMGLSKSFNVDNFWGFN